MNKAGTINKSHQKKEEIAIMQKRAKHIKNTMSKLHITPILIMCVAIYFRNTIIITAQQSYEAYKYIIYKSFNGISLPSTNQKIKISVNQNHAINKQQIAEIIRSQTQYSDTISISKIREEIMKNPIVKNITISRNIALNHFNIKIEEKQIVGIFTDSHNTQHLVDEEGNISQINQETKLANHHRLIELSDIEDWSKFAELYTYLKHLKIQDKIVSASMISNRRWDIKFDNGLLVKLPAQNWHKALQMIIKLDQKTQILDINNTVTYIDLRVENKIFLK